MDNYEKLGAFYLGRRYDREREQLQDDLVLYDSRDLTTHAVCVGMTGSGKTGLCVSLIEEATIDGVPSLIIDPKGDLTNLLLTFPQLRGEDFRPWINEDDARRKDLTPEAHAEAQAELWRKGLASWGQSGERVGRLRDAAEFAIYTPGSDAGRPVSILSSFDAPPDAVRSDGDLMRERVTSTATSLLALMGIDADPMRSREHVLVATVLDHLWQRGENVDLAGLIQALQSPPVERIGVMELDSFYPAKERFELAMQLNSLLAAPGFRGWLDGQSLDVQQLLYTSTGKPRVAILYIAHLSDAERMFFVSMLLNQVVAWMRGLPGTTSLRALLYMDEIFGFVPPTAEPPSKRLFLTLLKQARAYGLGVVLATQNPVDLDYKGLSNIGTWFLGRLQTERDKKRVLDGLEGAAGSFDKGAMERTLAGLGKRVFLMHNVHEREPVVFHTRWAMSYLRGPLTRQQIARLEKEGGPAGPPEKLARAEREPASSASDTRPLLPPGIPQVFLPGRRRIEGELVYRPRLLGVGRVRYIDRKTKKLKHSDDVVRLLPLDEEALEIDWDAAAPVDLCLEDLDPEPEEDAGYGDLPAATGNVRSYPKWRKQFSDALYRGQSLTLYRSPGLGLVAEPGESEGDFRVRLSQLGREKRDRQTEALRKKYARRLGLLEDRLRRAQLSVEKEQQQASGQKVQTAISLGATVLSAFLGRKRLSVGTVGRATTTMRGAGRVARESQDVKRAESRVAALRTQVEELNEELETELAELEDRLDAQAEELETVDLRPRRSDVEVKLVALAWSPFDGAKQLW